MYTRSWMSPAWLSPYGSIVVFFCVRTLSWLRGSNTFSAGGHGLVLRPAMPSPSPLRHNRHPYVCCRNASLGEPPTNWMAKAVESRHAEGIRLRNREDVLARLAGFPVDALQDAHIILDPGGCFAQLSLVVDGAVYAIALFAAKALCERCLWRRDNDGKTCKDK